MKPHTYRFVFAALLLTMLAVFGIAFTADSEPQNSSLKTDGMKGVKLAEEKMMSKQEERIVSKDKKILVVCYSFSRGNTRKIAKKLQTVLDADYAEIEPTHPYPPYGGWNSEVTEQGKREVEAGFMPEIKPLAVNIADYEIIAVVVYHGASHGHFPEIAGLDGQDGHSLYDTRRLAGACNHGHQGILRRGKICRSYGNTV